MVYVAVMTAEEIREILRAELTPVRADIKTIRADIAFVKARLTVMGEAIDVLQRDVRMTRAAINEFAKTNISTGEVEALHDDLQRVMGKQDDLAARMLVLEQARIDE
jgi:hypothetical protein